jgi:PAS domain S-box-containing protein
LTDTGLPRTEVCAKTKTAVELISIGLQMTGLGGALVGFGDVELRVSLASSCLSHQYGKSMAKPERRWWSCPPVIARYVVAVMSVAAALISSRWLEKYWVAAPVSQFLCAVMFSAWFGGYRPGLLAATLSVLAFKYYFAVPVYSLSVDIKEIPRLLSFSVATLFVGLLSAAQRSATESLRQARDELDGTVQELKIINEALHAENAERIQAEEALRSSEQRLQDIVDNTTAVIFVKDLALRYLLVNREFERLYQVQRDQIRGKTDFELHPPVVAETVRANDRRVFEAGEPIQFEEVVPSLEGERVYVSAKFLLVDRTGKPYAVCGIATDITALKRAEESQASMARERELFARQRATELAKANEALRGCLDALASVPELDDFLGQVMAAMTRQLGASSSVLRWHSCQENCLTLDLVFQDGRVMTPAEAKYPEMLRSIPLDERQLGMLRQPATVMHLLDNSTAFPDSQWSYLLELGVKTLLVIPLIMAKELIGSLTFRFNIDREFRPEEIEIARALASQASLAIQLTRLAKAARQSAVLEERNQLAGEIHDSLAQFFTGITMQLGAAREVIKAGSGNVLSYVERASEIAHFGLAEARRSAFSLQPTIIEELGLVEALQKLVERSNIPGRLRCNFHSTGLPEESLAASVQQDLLRIAQEAMSNAARHAKPTVISVKLRCNPPNLALEVTDNGSGIDDFQAASREGIGFSNMRARAENIGARLEVRSAAGRGTTIVIHSSLILARPIGFYCDSFLDRVNISAVNRLY